MSTNSDKGSLDNVISILQIGDHDLGKYGKVMLQSIYKTIPQKFRENKRVSDELINFVINIKNQIDKAKLQGNEWYKVHRLETHRRIQKIILLNIWENEVVLRRVLPNVNEDELTERLFETMLKHAVNKKLTKRN